MFATCFNNIILLPRKAAASKFFAGVFSITRAAFLLVLLQSFFSAKAQNQSTKFIRLTTNEGLSQGHVNATLKDRYGFMWFATEGGLNKYDGYKFTAYKHDEENPESISNSIIADLLEDYAGNLWVGTRSGVDKLDRTKDKFIHYKLGQGSANTVFEDSRKRIWAGKSDGLYVLDPANGTFKSYKHSTTDASTISDNFIYKITEDNGELWIATKNGLNRFNLATQKFRYYKNNPHDNTSIGADWVRAVIKDSKGNIWVATKGGGFALYNPAKDSFINYKHDANNSNSVCHNDILSFAEDANGKLWIGTENGGISVFNPATNVFSNYKNDPYNINSISSNSVYSIYKDNLGALWIGTYSEGVNYLPRNAGKFIHYNQDLSDKNSLNDHTVLSITGDSNDNLWIGTDGGGLNKLNTKTQSFTHYLNNEKDKNSINSNYVISVIQVDENLLGLGLYGGGFDLLNTKTGRFTHNMPDKDNPNSISSTSVIVTRKSHDGNVWIGTLGGGVDLYNTKNNTFTHYKNNPKDNTSIGFSFINCMLEDHEGNLWVGSADGLDMLNRTTGAFTHYRHSDGDRKTLRQNFIQSMFEDHANNLWFGTSAGLSLFNRKTKTFTTYTEKDGLANNMIQSIMEDMHGHLWLGSNGGLMNFNPITKACRNYNASDGLQGKEFKPGSCYHAKDGKLYFGGTNGFNAFYPDSLKDNNFIPPVYITDFQVFNKQVKAGGEGAPLKEEISVAKQITLSYNQSVFSFEFSALNYYMPGNNQYAYKLAGFDKDWIYAGTKRTATYTNLDPGKYIFHVKGTNNDGVWNKEGASVTVTILPPYWMTWWFRSAAILTVISSVAGFYLFRINIIKKQKIKLEQQVHEQTAQLVISNEEERKARQEADEANRAKSVFLATMSHEIRTPMNGVIGMASLLMQTKLSDEQRGYTKIISTSSESLLSVINGILDFSKIESGKMELENKLFHLPTCIDEALEIFSAKARETNIKLAYKIDENVPSQITGDSLRLRQVLINLVGNAMKFTAQGEVFISVQLSNTPADAPLQISFKVRDSGIGIPADKLKRLFKAFSQVDSSTTRKHGGTGLGLVICEKLVSMMGGTIQVESEPGKGTTFTFSIQTTAVANHDADELPQELVVNTRTNKYLDEQTLTTEFSCLHPLRILIAEDNAVNMLIAKTVLNKLGYQPAAAENGQKVLDMLSKEPFDLIFMDVQMPEMDGLEATKIIRGNYQEQPIVIAMTANAMQGDKEECIRAGMDDYISKPLNLDVLVSMLKRWAMHINVVQSN